MLIDVTNIEKDTVYSLIDLSLIDGTVLDHFENGMIKINGEYKNGIKNGDYKNWHSNGQLILKGNYVDGQKTEFLKNLIFMEKNDKDKI